MELAPQATQGAILIILPKWQLWQELCVTRSCPRMGPLIANSDEEKIPSHLASRWLFVQTATYILQPDLPSFLWPQTRPSLANPSTQQAHM